MNSLKRFDETKLPDKKHSNGTLNNEHVSNNDYEHAVRA